MANTARILGLSIVLAFAAAGAARGADQPQWGQRFTRNMVSAETGLPDAIDPATGLGVKWIAPLGSQTYATPVVAGGKVLIGTNNDSPRDPAHKGDRGALLCLNEKDGSLCWQLLVPKLSKDPFTDWPHVGISSPATVEGDRVYAVTNRNEVLCLDIQGLANGNDGPFQDEARQLTPKGAPPEALTARDADILWVFDMPARINITPHDSAHSSILIDGDILYVNTSNGIGSNHKGFRNPAGASLIALDKHTGRLLAMDKEGIGGKIFHGNWSSPALGEAGGRKLVFYGSGDGVLRAFEPLGAPPAEGAVATLKRAWLLACDPTAPKDDNIQKYLGNRTDGPSVIEGLPVYDRGRIYLTVGGDIWWGKMKSWLKCIDAASGKQLWAVPLEKFGVSTPSVQDGLVYATDCAGNVHCVEAATGKPVWTHKLPGEVWASTLLADGKLYVGTLSHELWILAAGRQEKVLGVAKLDAKISATAVAANGTVYVATMKSLYAFAKKK